MEGEYSAAADPVESGRGDSGEQIFTHQGGGLQGEVPLQKTEHSEDVEVLPSRPMRGEPGAGRHGGRAMEELTTPRSQPKGDDDRRQR
jgi:hypothetical protein